MTRFSIFSFLMLAGITLSATPASANPILSDVSTTPEVISPNGDFIQDEVKIFYTVLVDTAQVSIILTPPGGAGTVYVIQSLTKQGQGAHVFTFDGLAAPGEPVADGEYSIRVFGVETSGEGREEAVLLPLVVDTVAPEILSTSVAAPVGSVVSNGATILIDVCVDTPPDTVLANFSSIDTEFDPDSVKITELDAGCYRIEYTVSENNLVPDVSPLQIPVEVFDAGGNSDKAFALLCLSNFPPEMVDLRILNDFNNFVNGDTIVVRVQFTSPQSNISIFGNFSALDSHWSSAKVSQQDLGNLTYDLSYPISLENQNADGHYVIEVTGRDNGCGVVKDTVGVTLDNGGVFSPIITNVSLSPEAFSPNGDGFSEHVTIRFTVVEDSVIVRISLIGDVAAGRIQNVPITFEELYLKGDHTYIWNGELPQVPALECDPEVSGKDMQIRLYGRTPDFEKRRVVTKDLRVDCRAPSLMALATEATSVRNGDRIEISLTYDEANLNIAADFSNLDSEFDGQVPVNASGVIYTVIYDISSLNHLEDALNIVIPITATDPAGNRSSDSSVRFCLDNNPPGFVNARFVDGEKAAYKSGDSFRVESVWNTTVPLDVVFDFSNIDADYDPAKAKAFADTSDSIYTLTYTIGDADDKDATGIPIGITATEQEDEGCGETSISDVFRINIDTERPRGPLVDDPTPVVREPRVLISGLAEDSSQLEVKRNSVIIDTLLVHPDGSIVEDYVDLVPGRNVLDFVGIDKAGNRSTPGRPKTVFFANQAVATIPKPFSPGNTFFIALLEPADSVVLRIINFEGMTVQRLEGGPGDTIEIPWDGIDADGSFVNSGPYIALIEIDSPSGKTRLQEPFVFTNR